MTRYILWAIPADKTDRLDEQPLTSVPLTDTQVAAVTHAARKDGWHSFRTSVDTPAVPDFAAGVRVPATTRTPLTSE